MKFRIHDVVKCVDRTAKNVENLVLGAVYEVIGASVHDGNEVYALKTKIGTIVYATGEKFQKVGELHSIKVNGSTFDGIISEEIYGEILPKATLYSELPKGEQYRRLVDEMRKIYVAKNTDYGDSFVETMREFGLISVATRLSDKFLRFKQLIQNEGNVKDESIEDTLLDMANYCIMTVMEMRRNEIADTSEIVTADRSINSASRRPMTTKQRGYIAGLTTELGLRRTDLPEYLSEIPDYHDLSEDEASTLIEKLLVIKSYINE